MKPPGLLVLAVLFSLLCSGLLNACEGARVGIGVHIVNR